MEYINGTSMDMVIKQVQARDSEWIKKVLLWMRYLCEPLQYIHSKNMVHRDLKPGNIMIMDSSADTPLKLLDFRCYPLEPGRYDFNGKTYILWIASIYGS